MAVDRLAGGLRGVQVDKLVSACANWPKSATLVGERTRDAKGLRLEGWAKDRILLADLGYYPLRLFPRIEEHGGSFVRRWKKSAAPLFVRSLKLHREQAIILKGKRLPEMPPKLQRQGLDAEMELSFQDRVYVGEPLRDTFHCRLVAVWDAAHGECHTYLPNTPAERLTAAEVAHLYCLRWVFELTFEELKSLYALDKFRMATSVIVEALIWSTLMTLGASPRIYNLVRRIQPPVLPPRHPARKWSRVVRGAAREIPWAWLTFWGRPEGKASDHDRAIVVSLTRMALDSHVKRHWLREEWSTGTSLSWAA